MIIPILCINVTIINSEKIFFSPLYSQIPIKNQLNEIENKKKEKLYSFSQYSVIYLSTVIQMTRSISSFVSFLSLSNDCNYINAHLMFPRMKKKEESKIITIIIRSNVSAYLLEKQNMIVFHNNKEYTCHMITSISEINKLLFVNERIIHIYLYP